MNKEEIVKKLDALKIEHDSQDSKAELELLLPEEPDEPEPVVKAGSKKAKFKALIEAYKVKNPTKYELKKEALGKQLAAL